MLKTNQSKSIYNIENEVFLDLYNENLNQIFDEYEIYDFFDFICNSNYFKRSGGTKGELTMIISYDRRRTICKYYPNIKHISLVPWGANPITVCHEIAHYLCDKVALDLPDHGATFTTIFINLCFIASPILGYKIMKSCNDNCVVYFKENIEVPNIHTFTGGFYHDRMCA
jgi:hypothetical protein